MIEKLIRMMYTLNRTAWYKDHLSEISELVGLKKYDDIKVVTRNHGGAVGAWIDEKRMIVVDETIVVDMCLNAMKRMPNLDYWTCYKFLSMTVFAHELRHAEQYENGRLLIHRNRITDSFDYTYNGVVFNKQNKMNGLSYSEWPWEIDARDAANEAVKTIGYDGNLYTSYTKKEIVIE